MKAFVLASLFVFTSCITLVKPSSPSELQAQFAEPTADAGSVAFTLGVSKTDFIPEGTVEMLVKNQATGSTATVRAGFPTSPNSLPGKKFGHTAIAAVLPIGTYKVESVSIVIPAHQHLRMRFSELSMTTGIHDQIPTFEIKPKTLTHLFNFELTLQLAKSKSSGTEFYSTKYWTWYEHPGNKAWKEFAPIINAGNANYLKKDAKGMSFVSWSTGETKTAPAENEDQNSI